MVTVCMFHYTILVPVKKQLITEKIFGRKNRRRQRIKFTDCLLSENHAGL